jgi:dTMP kinase
MLQEHLVGQRQHALFADPAAYGLLGQLLRSTIVRSDFTTTPDLDAVLFTALRADGFARMLETARTMPEAVILLERWSLAVHAYGTADGADDLLMKSLCDYLDRLVVPNVTLVLDVSPQVARERLSGIANLNRFESREPEFMTRVGEAYRVLSRGSPQEHVILLDSNGPATRTFIEAAGALRNVFPDLWWPSDRLA